MVAVVAVEVAVVVESDVVTLAAYIALRVVVVDRLVSSVRSVRTGVVVC